MVITVPIVADDDQLERTSARNPGYRIEREPDGSLTMSPTGSDGAAKSGEAYGQLREYAKRSGGRAFDASAGFAIGPEEAVRAPDASWISSKHLEVLEPERRRGFWRTCPDVVVEVRSESDAFSETVAAVDRFMDRGATYGVAIDPYARVMTERGTRPPDLEFDVVAIFDA